MDKIIYIISMLILPVKLFSFCISANAADDSISIINYESSNDIQTITVGKNPRELLYDKCNNNLYISNSGNQSITSLNLEDGKSKTYVLSSEPRGISLDFSKKLLYVVLKNENRVVALNALTFEIQQSYLVGNGPRNVVSIAHGFCCSNNEADTVTIYENDVAYTCSLPRGAKPYGLAIHNSQLYVTCIGDNSIRIFDIFSKTELKKISVGAHPTAIQFHPTKSLLYITALDENSITVIDLVTYTARESIPVGLNPFALAISPDKKYIAATNNGDNTVSIIDLETHRPMTTLKVGNDPHGILWF